MNERELWENWYILDDLNQLVPVISTKQHMEFQRDFSRRIVGKTHVTPDIEVSTVFLGRDHQYGDGPPLVFESMVFGGSDDIDQECWRYSTWTEADQGHAAAIEWVKAKLADAARIADLD